MKSFIHSFQSEWLKTKHSSAAWLTVSGSLFIPAIILAGRLIYSGNLYKEQTSGKLWTMLYTRNWQYMGILLLPLGIILIVSLITQMEYRHNAWKQMHTTPQSYLTLFSAKLAVIFVMLLHFLLLFTAGIYADGVIPCLFHTGIPYPGNTFPLLLFIKGGAGFLLAALPIVALQFSVGLLCRNFLVPVGIGLSLFVASLISVKWQYSYMLPYSYTALQFNRARHLSETNFPAIYSSAYFIIFITTGYIFYITQKDKS